MPVRFRKCKVRFIIHSQRRRNIEENRLHNFFRIIYTSFMRDSRSPIMRTDIESLMSQSLHHIDAIFRHDGLAVCDMVFATRGFGGLAVATQFEGYDGIGGGQLGG